MSTGDTIRWGICGTGRIANEFAECLQRVDDASLVAVASHDAARSREFADRHEVSVAHVGTAHLAGDENVDVVYVASTQDRHMRDTVEMLSGGRHVLCEKPFALSLDDAKTMIGAAAENERFLMEALWSRFLPSYVGLGEHLRSGSIGEPLLVEANFSFRVAEDAIAGHRLFDAARGGGALFDLGVYPVQLAHFVLGAPTSIDASSHIGESGVDEQTAMLLGYDSGASALLHTAIRTPGSNSARIAGSEGVIEVAPFMHAPNQFTITRDGGSEVFDFPRASLHFQVPEVQECIRAGRLESSTMPHAETLAIMNTLDAVRRRVGLEFPLGPTVH
jgi:predicted dehydrogenase